MREQQRGAAALRDGRLTESERHLAEALRFDPDAPDTHASLAGLRYRTGRWAEAAEHGLRLIALRPEAPDPAAHLLVGDSLHRLGRSTEALVHLRRITELVPGSARAWSNLASVCAAAGRPEEALRHYERAADLDPSPEFRHRAAAIRYGRGDIAGALADVAAGLAAQETADGRALFAQCLLALLAPIPAALHPLALRALTEPWGRPTDVAPAVIATLRQPGVLGEDLAALARNELLLGLLVSARVADAALESALTAARGALLARAGAAADDGLLRLACALARQCFLNEYVYPVAAEEAVPAARLRDRIEADLAAGRPVAGYDLAVLGCYLPLDALAGRDRLQGRDRSEPVAAVLAMQLDEPAEERAIRAAIPVLTPIADATSSRVRAQYEENPYPRWCLAAPAEEGLDINTVLRNLFPQAPFRPLAEAGAIDILIAGCGTGRVAQEVARRFPTRGRLLAVDLSRASLAYAMRQARRDGVAGLAYAQADILGLPALGQGYDLIDVSGVLHHMASPLAGWEALLSILRPGGCMRVGLYSALGRQDVAAGRRLIAERGLPPTAEAIRAMRQDIMAHPDPLIRAVTQRGDFYSLSECRDLLFHVQEVPMHLPDIAAFISKQGLVFLGFDLPAAVAGAFDAAQPGRAADLDAWIAFEAAHPQAFAAMYQLWVQKPAD